MVYQIIFAERKFFANLVSCLKVIDRGSNVELQDVILLPATIDDARDLWEWRNDPVTRANSFSPAEIDWVEHTIWLQKVLEDPMHRIYIGKIRGVRIGTCRVEQKSDGVKLLSWTIDPSQRQKGYGKLLVRKLVESFGNCLAEIKVDNHASIKIAEAAGLVNSVKKGEVLIFQSPSPTKLLNPASIQERPKAKNAL